MGKVAFVPLDRSAETLEGETLLDAARRAGATIGNSCGATGICARCRVTVLEGGSNLSEPAALELSVSARRGLRPEERLACQAVVRGECKVTTDYWK